MKRIINKKTVSENLNRLHQLIDNHISELKANEYKNQKKIIEVCHVGKLLMNLDDNSSIEKACEVPDFIVRYNENLIGIEHQTIVDSDEKSHEGFFQNIFKHAEIELKKDDSVPNVLMNCWLHHEIEYKLSQKEDYIKQIVQIIKKYVSSNTLEENSIIQSIYMMPHVELCLSPNFGAWWQKFIDNQTLQNAIDNKEKRIAEYRKNIDEVWLLIVIGGTDASSYQIEDTESYVIKSTFDKVFILEDYPNNLYQLK